MRTLIIYFSRKGQNYVNGSIVNLAKGNTEIVAEYIAKACNGELFEIKTLVPYPADYNDCIDIAKKELMNHQRPQLQSYIKNLQGYNKVIVAGPCWWGTYPMAILSAIVNLNFKNITVYPVMTHEGSGLGGAARTLKKYCQNAVIGKGLAIHGADAIESEHAIVKWVNENILGGK